MRACDQARGNGCAVDAMLVAEAPCVTPIADDEMIRAPTALCSDSGTALLIQHDIPVSPRLASPSEPQMIPPSWKLAQIGW
jgi:hypothetical protein